jgi:MFS transporter, CP family, cyanate transporter
VIIAVALNLRIGIVSIGPLLEDIRASLDMSRPLAGLVTMLPVLALAVFSVLGGRWIAAVGVRAGLLAALVVLTLAILARAVAPNAALLLAATVPIGAALAVAGAGLPFLVKERFARSTGAVTGAYVAALDIGAGVAALTAVPLGHVLGDWRLALAATAVPVALAIPVVACLRDGHRGRPARRVSPIAVDRRVVGLLAGVFAAQSICFLGLITWIAPLYEAAGWSAEAAGLAAAVVIIGSIPTAVLAPSLSDRLGSLRVLTAVALCAALGVLGLALWPTALPELWLPLVAMGTGALFPLALMLPLDVAPDAETAGRLAGMAVGIGYGLSALAPVAVGVVHDATGAYDVAFILLAACAAASVPLARLLST